MMMRRLFWMFFAAMSAFALCQGAEDDPLDGYLEWFREPRLRHAFILVDEQTGIAGRTGKIWRVLPGGECRVTEYRSINGEYAEHTREAGKIDGPAIVALCKTAKDADFRGIPDSLGKPAKVNPRRIIIEFGDQAKVVNGARPQTGDDRLDEAILAMAEGSTDPVFRYHLTRFMVVADAIRDAPKGGK